jgi:hypothetical protein
MFSEVSARFLATRSINFGLMLAALAGACSGSWKLRYRQRLLLNRVTLPIEVHQASTALDLAKRA